MRNGRNIISIFIKFADYKNHTSTENNMKKILTVLFACLPIAGIAQSEWEKPMSAQEKLELAKKAEAEAKKAQKEAKRALKAAGKKHKEDPKTSVVSENDNTSIKSKDWEYIQKDAIQEKDGKVVFSLDIDLQSKNAEEIYEKTYAFLDKLAQEERQIASGIALFNKNEHVIAAKYSEWMEFTKTFIMLDRAEFNYTIIARCTDNHLSVTLERISYEYEKDRPGGFTKPAEEVITDKYAVNKKKTKLLPMTAKFRRKTIDRKNQIFNNIKELFK